jgi:hypothetical protein
MAIDQRDVSSTLRFMDDRALQRYAAMHKSDPYIFPLAFQESQNRQKLRMSQQAQMAQQPQPKVADQALAQMMPQQPRPMAQPMPEAQGIGALPAGNMEGMADGGIVGYEGYDESGVPNTFGEGPVRMMADGGVARYQVGGSIESRYQQESQEMGMGTRMQYSPEVRAYAQAQEQASRAGYAERERQRMLRGPYADAAPAATAAATPNRVTPTFSPDDYSGMDRRIMSGSQQPSIQSITPPAKPAPTDNRDAASKADTGRKAPVATDPSAKTDTGGLDSLIKDFTRQTDLAQGALKNQRVGLGAELVKSAEEAKAEGEKRRKEEGDVFAGREARLAEREKGVAGLGDKYMGLALLQAGAAMMSTPGNLGSVIGKGIAVGSERYIAGIDKINAAKDKFAEARDRLDDLRLNRADMTKKEIRDEDNAIRNARLKGQELLLDGATNDLKISNDNQKAIFGVAAENIQTDKRITSAEKIARMQAASGNKNNQLEMLQALQADPKLMATYRAMQGKNEDVMGQYNDFLKANPTLAMDPKAAFTQFLMTKSAFQQLGTPTVTDKPTGPVRN